jgi:hypothetical protein
MFGLFGGSQPEELNGAPAPPSTCMSGGKKRRSMKKRSMKKRSMKKRSMKKRSMKKRSMKKRSMKKRSPSKTRPGRLDFVTHKGDKDYNARGHRQVRANRPYSRRR